jgi:hypothetical protein
MKADMETVLRDAEVLVIGTNDARFRHLPEQARPGQVIIDLVRTDPERTSSADYAGICW